MGLPDNGKERKAILLCPYYVLSIVLGHGQMEIASDLLALVFLAKEEKEKKQPSFLWLPIRLLEHWFKENVSTLKLTQEFLHNLRSSQPTRNSHISSSQQAFIQMSLLTHTREADPAGQHLF